MKYVILTLSVGERPFNKNTFYSIEKYASKCKVPFYKLSDIEIPNKLQGIVIGRNNNLVYLKKILAVRKYLETYDRVLWLDDTCFVSPSCPDLFSFIPQNYMAAPSEIFQPYASYPCSMSKIAQQNNINFNPVEAFNTGIVLYNKSIYPYLSDDQIMLHQLWWQNAWSDQVFINMIVKTNDLKVVLLDDNFNRMSVHEDNKERNRTLETLKTPCSLQKSISNDDAFIYHITSIYDIQNRCNIFQSLTEKYYPRKQKFDIVVARYNEDIAWTKNFINVYIYNKGEIMTNTISLQNVGRETHTFYTHIVQNYDNLNDYIVFLQGNPFDHSPNLVENLRNVMNANKDFNFQYLSELQLQSNIMQCPYHPSIPIEQVYHSLFQVKPESNNFSFGQGGQFIVSKNQILRKSKQFYQNIVNMLNYDIDPIEGYVIERLHKFIFSTSIPKLIFTYWHNENIPDYINDCINTWYYYCKDPWKINVLNSRTITDFLTEDVDFPANIWNYPIVKQTEMFRFALIKKYGGIWMDANIIMRKPIDFICDKTWYGYFDQLESNMEIFMFASCSNCSVIEKIHRELYSLFSTSQTNIMSYVCEKYQISDDYLYPQYIARNIVLSDDNLKNIVLPNSLDQWKSIYLLIKHLVKLGVQYKEQIMSKLKSIETKIPIEILDQPLLKLQGALKQKSDELHSKNSWWSILTSKNFYTFIHPTKTGGTAVAKVLTKYYPNHFYHNFRAGGHTDKCENTNNPIIIIRDPYDRFLSMYNYWKFGAKDTGYVRSQKFTSTYEHITVDDYIEYVKQDDKVLQTGFTWRDHYMPQTFWINNTLYENLIVILYDADLNHKIQALLSTLEIDSTQIVKLENVTERKVNKLTQYQKEFVSEYYKSDFELLNIIRNEPSRFKYVF